MQILNLLETVALTLLHSNIGIYLYETEGARARQHDVQCQQQESQPESHSAPLETGRGSGDYILGKIKIDRSRLYFVNKGPL